MKGADLLKFLLSLDDVWIHTGDSDLHGFVSWAVPIFFVLSGFFLFGKIFASRAWEASTRVISTWMGKTLRLYLIWTLIYLPFAIYGFALEGTPWLKSSAIWLRNVIFVGENYLSWPLRYLLGMLQAGCILWLAYKCRMPFWALCLAAALFAALPYLAHLDDCQRYITIFKSTRNGFFLGFPLMVLGGLLRKLFPGIVGWPRDTLQYKAGLTFRFMSIHIYLTHMLWVGLLGFLLPVEKGFRQWGIAVLAALLTGLVVYLLPALQQVLYGRKYKYA